MLLVPIRILCPEVAFKKHNGILNYTWEFLKNSWIFVRIGRKVLSKDKVMELSPEKDRQIWGQ